MAWVCVDRGGRELKFEGKPVRFRQGIWWYDHILDGAGCVELPEGTIEELIGRELTWEDEPVELKEEE